MNLQTLEQFLMWCTIINFGILFVWLIAFSLARKLIHRLHSRMFRLTAEQFDAIHYTAMVYFKLAVILVNLTPWVALQFLK